MFQLQFSKHPVEDLQTQTENGVSKGVDAQLPCFLVKLAVAKPAAVLAEEGLTGFPKSF